MELSSKKQTFLIVGLGVLLAVVSVESYLLFSKEKEGPTKEQMKKSSNRFGEAKHKLGRSLGEEDPWERDFFAEMRGMQRRIDRMFDESFTRGFDQPPPPFGGSLSWFDPEIDLVETPDGFLITCDVPGLEKSALDIYLEGNVLTIEGERGEQAETKDKGEGWIRRERHFGSFSRSISLPALVDPGSIKAEYKNGVLRITVKKRGLEAPEKTKINVI